MAKLIRAIGENHNHYGIIHDDGEGITSKVKNHIHGIKQEVMGQDEAGNAIIGFIVLPDVKDGHTHEISLELDFEKKKKEITKNNKNDLARAIALTESAFANNRDYFKKAKTNMDFYLGGDGQWDKDVIAELRRKGLTRVTLNYIKVIINFFWGYSQENSKIPKCYPTENGDEKIADLLTHLLMYFWEKNNTKYERGVSNLHQISTGRGVLHVRIDGPKYINGELTIEDRKYDADIVIDHCPYDDVAFGPHTKQTLDDCEYCVRRIWVSLDKIKSLVPNDAKNLTDFYFFGGDDWKMIETIGDQLVPFDPKTYFNRTKEFINKKDKKIALMYLYEKKYKFEKFIADLNSDWEVSFDEYDLTEKQQNELLTIDGFEKINKSTQKIVETTYAGNIHISTQEKDFNILPLLPSYATKIGEIIQGKIEDLQDPQREKNHRRSHLSDQANKSGKGYYAKANTFDETHTSLDDFEEMAGTNGWLAIINDNEEPPKEATGILIDKNLVVLDQIASRDMEEISGRPEALFDSNVNSNILFQKIKQTALTSNSYIFEGQSIQQKLIARLLIDYFRIILTPERVYRILSKRSADTESPQILLAGQPFESYSKETIMRLWQYADLYQYDIVEAENDYSPAKILQDFETWIPIITQVKDPMALKFITEMAPFPPAQKERLMQITNEGAQQRIALEQMKSQTELTKTEIARQGRQQKQVE